METLSMREFEERCLGVLDELDELAEAGACGGELEELNAELEDALMLLAEARPEDEDWREELEDALEELDALAADYRALSGGVGEIGALALKLEQAVRMAAEGLRN